MTDEILYFLIMTLYILGVTHTVQPACMITQVGTCRLPTSCCYAFMVYLLCKVVTCKHIDEHRTKSIIFCMIDNFLR